MTSLIPAHGTAQPSIRKSISATLIFFCLLSGRMDRLLHLSGFSESPASCNLDVVISRSSCKPFCVEAMRTKSSAKANELIDDEEPAEDWIEYPVLSGSDVKIVSMIQLKSSGESGSPCLTPRVGLISDDP